MFSEFLKTFTFRKELVCLFYKSLPCILNFVNCKGPCERPFHNICPCFDIVFAQLGVIPIARNEFAEIVAAAECYLNI